jgi:hypothetical protein
MPIDSEDPADHVKATLWVNFYSDGSFEAFATKQKSDDSMAFPIGSGDRYAHCVARTTIDVDICKGVGL